MVTKSLFWLAPSYTRRSTKGHLTLVPAPKLDLASSTSVLYVAMSAKDTVTQWDCSISLRLNRCMSIKEYICRRQAAEGGAVISSNMSQRLCNRTYCSIHSSQDKLREVSQSKRCSIIEDLMLCEIDTPTLGA